MTAPDIIKQLVERFVQHRETYRAEKYNETQLRNEFLNPFLEALGWDLFNKQGYAEMYKDVIHEASLEIEGENKAPDYAFRIGGTRKFFVEVKKPAVNIESNIHPAFQLRRYAWSAKLPLGILTDFEEFAVYDCRVKPDKGDKASTGRVKRSNSMDTKNYMFVINDAPYGNERPYNALRLALNLVKREEAEIKIFLTADGVFYARKGQKTPEGYYNIERMIKSLAKPGKIAI